MNPGWGQAKEAIAAGGPCAAEQRGRDLQDGCVRNRGGHGSVLLLLSPSPSASSPSSAASASSSSASELGLAKI